MKLFRKVLAGTIALTIMLTTAGYSLSQTGESDTAGSAIHMVIEIDGSAQIHRGTWTAADAVDNLAVGDLVSNDDRLIPVGASTILVLCGNQVDIATVREFADVARCDGIPVDPLAHMIPQPRVANDRGPLLPGEIAIITPRSLILTTTPTIRWTTLDNAVTYRVSIVRNADSQEMWGIDGLVENKLTYPPDKSPLTPGTYSIFVEPRNAQGRAISNGAVELITLVDPATIVLSTNGAEPPALVSDGMRAYLAALDYARNHYYSDAVATLEASLGIDLNSGGYAPLSAQLLMNSPQAFLDLGDWYSHLQLSDFAKQSYQIALDISQINAFQNNAALAQYGLAQFENASEKKFCYYQSSHEFFVRVGWLNPIVDEIHQHMQAIGIPPETRGLC